MEAAYIPGACEGIQYNYGAGVCCSNSASPAYDETSDACIYTCDPRLGLCSQVVCKALDQCHDVGTCNPDTGLCSNPVLADGLPCDAGNSCFIGDTCIAGTCTLGVAFDQVCCGNGILEPGEACDDGNQAANPQDGCAANCTVDPSWECSGAPSQCVVVTTTTTTTLTPQQRCGAFAGIARARCLIAAALESDLCVGETVPTKVDRALRAQLAKAADRLAVAATSEGRQRARMLKKALGALRTTNAKAAAAAKSRKAADRISSDCRSRIGGLVSAIKADVS